MRHRKRDLVLLIIIELIGIYLAYLWALEPAGRHL